jgi:hypothetical protein
MAGALRQVLAARAESDITTICSMLIVRQTASLENLACPLDCLLPKLKT